MNEQIKHENLINKVDNIQQSLLYCMKNDCSHCEYRQYKTMSISNCIYYIDDDIYDILEEYKQILLSYEKYRKDM